ncbi:hypothetical protein NQ176_g6154 [Zarea fungicola]|uniref:Uncharacterized protein n=1 Tax=Zarea fungicola TaxID=93591 RepID=A0ACC1N6J9_9HYPO|nr:hypothetical protein NQ176_g6154 [Lecanicillium fungicola]
MAAGAPNSSWHPALMPDTVSKGQEHSQAAAPQQPDVHDDAATPMIHDATHSQAFGDAWMSGEGQEDEADAWLMSEDPTLQSVDGAVTEAAHSRPSFESAHFTESAPYFGLPQHTVEAQDSLKSAETTVAKQAATSAFHANEDEDADAWFADESTHDVLPAEETDNASAIPPAVESTDNAVTEELESEPQPEPGVVAAPEPEAELEAERVSEPEQKGSETQTHQPLSQHSSSMSFARTVSHEISFNDDDESEWTLPRSDTDPFKFMPPSDRTNSFPIVPPVRPAEDPFPSHPLPSNQALDVVEELDNNLAQEETEEHGSFWENDAPAQRTIGGEIGDAVADATQSRFEEGLPLIPAAAEVEEPTQPGHSFDAFGAEDNNDDFFSQIKQEEPSDDFIQPIQRKSTMQVIGNSLNGESTIQAPGFDTLEEHAEEDHHAQALADAFAASGNDEIQPESAEPVADLSAKWQEAFATGDDDDDFLLDDAGAETEGVDATGFLGSDDEGLLLDDDDEVPAANTAKAAVTNPYLPSQSQPQPASAPATSYGYATQPPQQSPYGGSFGYAPAAPQRPDMPKAESFADKAKGGYSSPYDLPTDLVTTNVKPRKRPSLPQVSQGPAPPPMATPPHSANAYAPFPGATASAPPTTGVTAQAPPPRTASRQENFFEDLPVASKPRPASRQSLRAASPSKQYGVPSPTDSTGPAAPPPMNQQYQPAPAEAPAPPQNVVPNLVSPPKVNPYAALQTGTMPPPAPAGNAARYSPAPAQQAKSGSAPPPATSNRFSPAPPLPRQNGSPAQPAIASSSQAYLPHLPRTSSPLAHFEIHHEKSATGADPPHFDRRASTNYEPRLNRVASLPPTREVDEEDETQTAHQLTTPQQQSQVAAAQYSPAPQQMPSAPSGQLLSPQKRTTSNYTPHAAAHPPSFAPPVRSQTQSPGATRQSHYQARPSSAHTSAAPVFGQTAQPMGTLPVRTRGASLTMNLVPPTDGRELDPLQRWQGVPIFSWAVGGSIVTSFPKSTPRYTMNQSAPTMLRTPGEVKIKSMKDIEPLPEHLAKFPGPLRGKSKKKDALAWLASGITALEKELPDVSFNPQLSLEAKRSIERLLLWKILHVFVEFDGHLEGSPAVEKSVREILSPQEIGQASLPTGSTFSGQAALATSMKADDVDSSALESMRDSLLQGDRESAVWSAVDKRLWGHALLIANATSPELYSRVAQEFVRKEVNYPGHSNQSLGAFYKVLSGNFEDCVDELVPVHARAGLQLMTTDAGAGPTEDVMSGLDKWRETLSLVLSNRSDGDIRGLNALGKLLSSYGRAEAAQICFIFSRSISVFGGIDDPNADFVLLGADHRQQSDQFAKETEALQLSEVYEYGLTLSGLANLAAGAPHLAGYKLQLATTLAEHGYRDKALQYCDAILTSMSAQTRRSPYHHAILEASVDDFMRRLKQAPKDDGSSWISKPSMNKVSDSVWNRFNKFVSGDEDANGQSGPDAEHGPFARIISTPNISRPPSASNFETYGTSPSYGVATLPPQAAASASRYAPAITPAAVVTQNPYEFAAQQPAPIQHQVNGRSSNEYSPTSYEPAYAGSNSGGAGYPGFNQNVQEQSYQPTQPEMSAYQPQAATAPVQPYGLQPSPSITAESNTNANYGYQGYQPAGFEPAAPAVPSAEDTAATNGGYQPPTQSYGYEAPATQSYGFEPPAVESQSFEPPSTQSQGYEPPATQSQGYEPPATQS